MSKAVKGWLIAAAALTVAGIAVFVGALASADFDFTRLGAKEYMTNTLKLGADFERIDIDVPTADINFERSEDKECVLILKEREKMKFSAEIENRTLVVRGEDTRKWFERLFLFERPSITVFLPKSEYGSLAIKATTGDISVPEGLKLGSLSVNSITSDVVCRASASDSVDIHLATGKIDLFSPEAGSVRLETTTGDISLNGVNASGDIYASMTTGDLIMKNSVISGQLSVECTTGDVRFESSDASAISVKTTTGDITGTLLSDKVITASSVTGEIIVPKSSFGGACDLKTTTGKIRIEILK